MSRRLSRTLALAVTAIALGSLTPAEAQSYSPYWPGTCPTLTPPPCIWGPDLPGGGYPDPGFGGYPWPGLVGYPDPGFGGYPRLGLGGYPGPGFSGYPRPGTRGYPAPGYGGDVYRQRARR
jgi:hypothetical protein